MTTSISRKPGKVKPILLSALFLAVIFLCGIAADVRVLRFYKSGEVLNEEWTPELGRKNETEYAAKFPGRETLINANGALRRLLGQREMNGVVRLSNGHVTALMEEKVGKKELKKEAANVAALSGYLKDRGIPFLFVLPPDKIAAKDAKAALANDPEETGVLPAGCRDYSNRNSDVFFKALEETGTACIDLRKEMERDGIDPYSLFYKTDHHWTQEAGFYAAGKIADWTLSQTQVSLDPRAFSGENYRKESYENVLAGTWAQRTGTAFAGSDAITLYVPTFETEVENLTFQKKGTMDEAVYNREFLKEGKPDFIFDAVFDATDQFVNTASTNDTTVLVICDSFGRVVNPFLICGARNMWFQSIYRSSEIDEKLLKKLEPDLVIMLFSPWYNLGKEDSFAFSLPGVVK